MLISHEKSQAKLTNPKIRAEHVTTYHIPFAVAGIAAGVNTKRLAAFLALSWAAHFVTDSKRWLPGELPWLSIVNDQALHAVQLTILNRVLGRSRL